MDEMDISENNCLFLSHLLDTLATGVFATDSRAVVRFINKAYADYLGYPKEQILGRSITEFIPNSRVPHVMASGTAEMGMLCPIRGKDGERTMIVNRLPLKISGLVFGVVSHALFGSREEYEALTRHIGNLDRQVSKYARQVRSMLAPRYSLDSIIGSSAAAEKMRGRIISHAATGLPVLVEGETGTGKELAASAIHCESEHKEGPFVSVNCAAIPDALFESELFGYAAGAFSGALAEGKIGFVEMADRGTLFLDEIGDTPLPIQAKLLRVLEERTLYRLGSTKPLAVNFRLVAATNHNLRKMIREGAFREDLYYRISSMSITLPALRERRDDVPALVSHFLGALRKDELTVEPEALQVLQSYDWPGNIRELRNAVSRASGLCEDGRIGVRHLPPDLVRGTGGLLAKDERLAIESALLEQNWNVAGAARQLGIGRATIYKKLRKYGLSKKILFSRE